MYVGKGYVHVSWPNLYGRCAQIYSSFDGSLLEKHSNDFMLAAELKQKYNTGYF